MPKDRICVRSLSVPTGCWIILALFCPPVLACCSLLHRKIEAFLCSPKHIWFSDSHSWEQSSVVTVLRCVLQPHGYIHKSRREDSHLNCIRCSSTKWRPYCVAKWICAGPHTLTAFYNLIAICCDTITVLSAFMVISIEVPCNKRTCVDTHKNTHSVIS